MALTTITNIAIPALVFLMMTVVGMELLPRDFSRVRQRPRAVLIGTLGQLLMLPPLALLIGWVLRLPVELIAGMVLVAACPGGALSNYYAWLARADVALSVTLTGVSTLLVAFTLWEGFNYEDAILLSERVARDDLLTSIHIEKYEIEARDTKLGPEEITRDIPNVGEELLSNLDENGIVRLGAEVGPEDLLVGKVAPKSHGELTAEERLVIAIFGKKAEEIRDASLRVPHGEGGMVVGIRVFAVKVHHKKFTLIAPCIVLI